jgi:hypothetical protein
MACTAANIYKTSDRQPHGVSGAGRTRPASGRDWTCLRLCRRRSAAGVLSVGLLRCLGCGWGNHGHLFAALPAQSRLATRREEGQTSRKSPQLEDVRLMIRRKRRSGGVCKHKNPPKPGKTRLTSACMQTPVSHPSHITRTQGIPSRTVNRDLVTSNISICTTSRHQAITIAQSIIESHEYHEP